MKSLGKLSMIVFVAVLCFAPCAFGQRTASVNNAAVSGVLGQSILSQAVPGLLTFAFDHDHGHGGNGCGGQGGNGWDDKDRRDGGGNCQSVPEGGSNLTYLFLASVACFGALLVQSLRKPAAQNQAAETDRMKQS